MDSAVESTTTKKPNDGVFVAVPTYNSCVNIGTASALHTRPILGAKKNYTVYVGNGRSSLLAFNFNNLWCDALNESETLNLKWFAMLHGDINPDDGWLGKLIELAEARDADILSVVVPICDSRGLSSTAISDPNNSWRPFTRLTLKQVTHKSFPETFDIAQARTALKNLPEELRVSAPEESTLLVNTGCMLIRLGQDWNTKLNFSINDRIINVDGKWRAEVEPEDWRLSRKAAELGLKVMATTAVGVVHHGVAEFNSRSVWGDPVDASLIKLASPTEQVEA